MLAIAAEDCPGLERLQGDMVETTLPPRTFDLILASFAYHHVEDARKASFCKRMLKAAAPEDTSLFSRFASTAVRRSKPIMKPSYAGYMTVHGGIGRPRS